MSEQRHHNNEPRILNAVENIDGSYQLSLRGTSARDIYATLRFHEPEEKNVRNTMSTLFDKAVELGMLKNLSIAVHDSASEQGLEAVEFKRTIQFSDSVTPEQARKAFITAYQHLDENEENIIDRVLETFIDSGRLPVVTLVFDSYNEIISAEPDSIEAELRELTERYYDGRDMGGPSIDN